MTRPDTAPPTDAAAADGAPASHLARGLRLAACLALAAATLVGVPADPALRAGLALFALVGSLWVTQALPLPVTALAVPLLAVLAGLTPPRQALASFAHPVIFLFLGGFALAAALRQQGLDRVLVDAMLRLAGGRRLAAVLLVAGLTAVLSMWMSNTATVALMLPLGLGLLATPGQASGAREQAFVLLALAYSASVGGMATLVGSPPNAIVAAQTGISFARWLAIGAPLALLLWPLMLAVLAAVLRPRLRGRIELPPPQRAAWSAARWITALVFAGAVAGWTFGTPLARTLGITADMDTVVALAALLALVATGCLDWPTLERHVQWGVLLLFGGGLALGEVMAGSGARRYLAQGLLALLQDLPLALVVLGVVAFVVFLTELVSNTASAALLLPLLLPVASALGLPPVAIAAAVGIAASCAFMLPVATPPNALVFGTGQVPAATMMRCGWWLNLVCIALISGMTLLAWG